MVFKTENFKQLQLIEADKSIPSLLKSEGANKSLTLCEVINCLKLSADVKDYRQQSYFGLCGVITNFAAWEWIYVIRFNKEKLDG